MVAADHQAGRVPTRQREETDMRFPQVGERVKEAPAHALRAMFAGIGQVLLVADRMRSRSSSPDVNKPATSERLPAASRPLPPSS